MDVYRTAARMYGTTRAVIYTLIVLAMIVVIPRSDAGILFHATDVTSEFIGYESDLTGYTAWQIDVSTDNGDLITAVDIAFGGPFHQRIEIGFDGLPGTTATGVPANGSGDSHLTPGYDALFAVNPIEDFSVASSPLSPGDAGNARFGVGSYLYGAWGIPGDRQSTRTPLAYLVLPDGAIDSLDYDLSIATRSGASSNRAAVMAEGELPELPGRPFPQPVSPGAIPTAPIPPVPTSTPDVSGEPDHDPISPGDACDDFTAGPGEPPVSQNDPPGEVILPTNDSGAVATDGNGEAEAPNNYDGEAVFHIAWEMIDRRDVLLRDLTEIPGELTAPIDFTGFNAMQSLPVSSDFLAMHRGAVAVAAGGLLSAGGTLSDASTAAKTAIPEPASGFYVAGIAAWLTGRRRRG